MLIKSRLDTDAEFYQQESSRTSEVTLLISEIIMFYKVLIHILFIVDHDYQTSHAGGEIFWLCNKLDY